MPTTRPCDLYILDTDHVSLAQREHPSVLRRLAWKRACDIAVTVVTAEEQLRGWLKAVRRASSDKQRIILDLRWLRSALEYFGRSRLLDFDPPAFDRYLQLRQQKIRTGTQDLRIAAVTLALAGTLVTRNARDFSRVPGLAIEDWSSGPM